MAKLPPLVASALATWNGKALIKGKKDISAFDKQAQKLGKTFNRVFATTAIVAFSKKAISAFAADEAAAKSLAVQLENTGNAFRVGEVETYIAKLQNLYKVLDDQLRPAFQTLLNATGSVNLSQKALETALDVSAGTGASLETVISALAAGIRGNAKAIKGLNTGIDANIIKTGDMNKIMAALEKRFAGAALARLDTYAGKMDALKVAAADATEIIGAGLLDALSVLGKDNSIDQAANSMNGFAIAVANTARGMGDLIAQVKQIIDSDVGKFLLGLTALLALGKKQLIVGAVGLIAYDMGKPKPSSNFTYGAGNPRSDLLVTKNLIKARKDEFAIITASNKAKTELDKLRDKFDLERIGLNAALNAATDEETKLRIRAQLAILDNNEALAKKYNAELEGAVAVNKLAVAANTAATFLDVLASRSNPLFTSTGEMTARGRNQIAPFEGSTTYTVPQGVTNQGGQAAAGAAASTPTQATLEIAPNASADRLVQAIAETVRVNLKYGNKLLPAGGIE